MPNRLVIALRHRGPDLQPRNFVRALMLKAFSDEGVVPERGERHSQWRKRAKVRHAAIHNAAKVVQNILADVPAGISDAYGPALRVLELTADVMAPRKDEQGPGRAGPILPKFTSAPAANAPPAESAPPQPPSRRSIVDADGNVYEEVD